MEGGKPAPTTEPGICTRCGQAIVVQRWGLSVVEHWGRALGTMGFVVVAPSGFPPDHPGSSYVKAARDELFSLSTRCEGCFGAGVADDWKGDQRTCPYCLRVGRVPTAPIEALQKAHHRLFHGWPQYYRYSLLYGIPDAGERGVPPRYDGPSITGFVDPAKQVVYGPVPYTRIGVADEQAWRFLPLRHARMRATTHRIVENVATWGELRRGLDPEEARLVHDTYFVDGEEPQPDHASFDAIQFICAGPLPPQAAHHWLPASDSGAIEGVPLAEIGSDVACRESDVPAVVAHVERHGFTVIRDDLLVSAAHMPHRITDARCVAPHVGAHPEWPGWIVFHVPHASTHIPSGVRQTLQIDDDELRQELTRLTDHYADGLLVPPGLIPSAVKPGVSRLVVDVERFIDDDHEPMASVGMGSIYTRTSDGRPLRAAPSPEARRELLATYYRPHHERLTSAVDAALGAYGRVLILDLHTFPSDPLPCDLDQTPERPDICIGTDSFHTPAELRVRIHEQLTEAGWSVEIDRPYGGAMVPQHHLHRDERVASLMIEVNRRLYLKPDGVTPNRILESVGREIRGRVRRAIMEWDRGGQRTGET